MSSLSNDIFDKLLVLVEGDHIPMDHNANAAYRIYYSFKSFLSAKDVDNPITAKKERRILLKSPSSEKQHLILLTTEEKAPCIDFFFKRCKGESARKLNEEDR